MYVFFISYTKVFRAVSYAFMVMQFVCKTKRYINSGKFCSFLNTVFLNALCIINMLECQHQIRLLSLPQAFVFLCL